MTTLLFLATFLLGTDPLLGRVVKVTDGDTITVLVDRQEIKIRLNAIDAPERGQDFGQKSKEALADLVFGKDVRIETHGKDWYVRAIGDVYVGGTFVNEKMVEDGWAWNYVKYSKFQRLTDLERQARAAKRGLWAGKSPIAPWAFRAEKARKQREEEAPEGGVNMSSIFSTYSTGENRVTASVLAVLRSLSLDRIQRLLGALLESDFELVRFQNQPSKGGKGVPDAIIHASVRLLVETKIKRNGIDLPIDLDQIQRHLDRLDEANEVTRLLLVITPDDVRPKILDSLKDGGKRLVWSSFDKLDQAIDEMLEDKYEVLSEREAFLLRELQTMLEDEQLLANPYDVVVVAARIAWPEYKQLHAYVCQPNRSFQQVSRLAFYAEGVIQPLVPKILDSKDDVTMVAGKYSGMLGELVERIVKEQRREQGERNKVLLLSAPDSPDTLRLPGPIPNDLKSQADKPTAFTMGQRYIASERLLVAKTTGDLVPRFNRAEDKG